MELSMSEYADRDVEQDQHYIKHVIAMTEENLHNKGAIAAELAHRDITIYYWQNMHNSLDYKYSEKIMGLREEIAKKDKIISDYGWEESARNGGIQGQH